jgi:hypothetical protein
VVWLLAFGAVLAINAAAVAVLVLQAMSGRDEGAWPEPEPQPGAPPDCGKGPRCPWGCACLAGTGAPHYTLPPARPATGIVIVAGCPRCGGAVEYRVVDRSRWCRSCERSFRPLSIDEAAALADLPLPPAEG